MINSKLKKIIYIIVLCLVTIIASLLIAYNIKVKVTAEYNIERDGIFSVYYLDAKGNQTIWDDFHMERKNIEAGKNRISVKVDLENIQYLRVDFSGIDKIDLKSIRLDIAGMNILSLDGDAVQNLSIGGADGIERNSTGGGYNPSEFLYGLYSNWIAKDRESGNQ